ncbi:uncharacterized protein si:dkey-29d8.3 [Hippoglossus hippoglossus]|uniref:uncharacterized protein si:dkey-29d8.3 n=1 Tax=Hippoglossus hippoglossus TaxID=8267 RepID=UPI00148B96AA|nr:uncharacterized protein si:dkey-29d8.3 [Hippoglossus hippoglossus]XP_035026776.1 uncharacterized protein si:dkey-29d8.3 [Hippoglossus stenolepis]
MKPISLFRILVILLCAVVFVGVLIVNALAGAGKAFFSSSTGNVSVRYETEITPAGWTFSIWGVIYTWLTLMVIYITCYVFRGAWAQCLLPYAFYFCWLSNMVMNVAWLLLWDRELMLASLVVLTLISITNYSALFFCCFATDFYGIWLKTYHRKDLACLYILVQNGLALYTTWTSIASLINFSVVLHLWGVDKSTAATASLCILFGEVVAWFILENWVLDRWVRNILTVYPVVIVALIGNIVKHFNPVDPTTNSIFMVILLVLACVLLVSRVFTVIWKNRWRPLHSPGTARVMVSPLDSRKFRIFS